MTDHSTPALIARAPMHIRQFLLVALCCLLNMAEGYDVLSLALAAPQLTREWAVSPEMLGITFSAASVGLALGAVLVAPLADRVGRRSTVLAALIIITLAHWCLAVSRSMWEIAALRVAMGAGFGTLIVSLNVLVAEFSNDRWRNLLLSILHAGLSLGAVVSGATAALLLEPFGWRYIFVAGGALHLAVLLIACAFLPESPEYLISRQPRNALARVNAILKYLRHPPLESLPPMRKRVKIGVAALLSPEVRHVTVLIGIASFAYAVVSYFLVNWKPQVLVSAGLTPTQASYLGIVTGVFGMLGHLSIGLLSRWIEEARLTGICFALLALMLAVFGSIPSSPWLLLGTSGVITLCTVGAYTGLFLVAIKLYSTEMRNAGVGFMVGLGRAGAIVGPMLGGLLIGADLGRMMTFAVFAGIAVLPVTAIFLVARRRAPGLVRAGRI